jgi:hypothetical protein
MPWRIIYMNQWPIKTARFPGKKKFRDISQVSRENPQMSAGELAL